MVLHSRARLVPYALINEWQARIAEVGSKRGPNEHGQGAGLMHSHPFTHV